MQSSCPLPSAARQIAANSASEADSVTQILPGEEGFSFDNHPPLGTAAVVVCQRGLTLPPGTGKYWTIRCTQSCTWTRDRRVSARQCTFRTMRVIGRSKLTIVANLRTIERL